MLLLIKKLFYCLNTQKQNPPKKTKLHCTTQKKIKSNFVHNLGSLNMNQKLVFCIRLEFSKRLFFCYCNNAAFDANSGLYSKHKLELHHLES